MAVLARCLPLLLIASSLAAQTPEPGPAPRHVDQYGDPLPAGAIQRFGSLRLRHLHLEDFAILPDGKTLVSVGSDEIARWWDLDTGQLVKTLRFGSEAQTDSRRHLSDDGSVMAVTWNGTVAVIDPATGSLIHRFTGLKGEIKCVAVASDGSRLAVSTGERRVTVCECRTKKTWVVEPGGETEVGLDRQLSFSPDGKRLVVCRYGVETLKVLDADTLKETYSRRCASIMATFSPAGDLLAAVERQTDDRYSGLCLRLIDLKTGRETCIPKANRASHLSVSPDGKWVALATEDQTRLVEKATGRVAHQFSGGEKVQFTPDGGRVVLSARGKLFVRDTATGRLLGGPTEDRQFDDARFSPDGRRMAVGNKAGQRLEIWDTRTARVQEVLPSPKYFFLDWKFVENGRMLRLYDRDNVYTWDWPTGAYAHAPLPVPDISPPNHDHHLALDTHGRLTAINRGRLPADPSPLPSRLTVCDGATARILDRRPIAALADGRTGYKWLPASDRLIEWNTDGFSLIDIRSRRPAMKFATYMRHVSDDGRWITADVGRSDGLGGYRILEAETGQKVAVVFDGKGSSMRRVAVSGRTAVVTDGRTIWVMDLASGTERGKWTAPDFGEDSYGQYPVQSLELFPGGRTAFTALRDGTALTWDVARLPQKQLSDTFRKHDMEEWWAELADEDAARAYAAVWRLAEAPADLLIPFLRERLRPAERPSAGEWRKLIAALDHQEFRERAAAVRRLESFGLDVVEDLRAELKQAVSAEVRERLGQLIAKHATVAPDGKRLRVIRALAVLEEVNTIDARRLVAELSRGVATAPETRAAAATLNRMPDAASWGR